MKDILSRVADAMYCQIQNRGYAVPVDVLMDIGVLKKAKNDNRCAGRDPFLEAVCTDNLNKLSEMMKDMRDPLRLRAAGNHRSAAILLFWHVQKMFIYLFPSTPVRRLDFSRLRIDSSDELSFCSHHLLFRIPI